jgi:putative transposase
MALRWCAAGMVEAGKQFRRVNGHVHVKTLCALDRHVAVENARLDRYDQTVTAT